MGGQSSSTGSAIIADGASASHVLRIDGYSRTNVLLDHHRYAKSAPFSAGGYNWAIKYFPNGSKDSPGYLSIYLLLDSADAKEVKAQFSFSLLDKDGTPVPSYVSRCDVHTFPSKGMDCGFSKFIKNEELEEAVHLRDDSFAIRCDLIVMSRIRCEETKALKKKFVVVPPSNLGHHLGDLLKNMDGTNVMCEVGEKKFFEHTLVLTARSSVCKAELFDAMKANSDKPLKMEDMEPISVFGYLLHFIYTDSLPETGQERADVVLVQHFLVAADRYNVERLKLMCEERLCERIDSNIVATSLALAEQHSCHGLKEACFEFLSSSSNLDAMVASDGFEHLKNSCPSILVELTMRFLLPDPNK